MRGIIAAVPTPVCRNGNPIHDLFIAHCSWILDNGCDGINILGTTGEANSLSIWQRKQLMKIAANQLDVKKLMVGTATPSLNETAQLTRIADDFGYKNALVLPPYYYKPISNEGLFEWYKSLHERLASRKISIFFYK